MKKTIIFLAILLSAGTLAYAGNHNGSQNGTGIDPVLKTVGIEKPTEWQSWSEKTKHAWLQEQGIFPESGRKYEGSFSEEKYWDFLSETAGINKPENWDQLSFDQKKEYLVEGGNSEEPGTKDGVVTVEEAVEDEEKVTPIEVVSVEVQERDDNKTFLGEWLAILLYIVGGAVLLGLLSIWTTWKSKNSQQK